jgi:hypothetical protein
MSISRRSVLVSSLLPFCGGLKLLALGQTGPRTSTPAEIVPKEDARLTSDFLSELTAYKKDFRLPEWAKQGRARQIRFDGGPMFAACQFESGWKYLTDIKTPGFVGMIKSVWTLTNLYTDDIERRLDEIRAAGYNWIWASYQLGYALEDEARQRAQVRRLIQLAHARDIRVTAYFSLTSVFTTSAFIGNPESKNWIQEQSDGKPVAYSGIPVRLMACVNKPGRIEYLKEIVRLAVADGADDIFWDSIFNRCYCSYCEKGFSAYSQRVMGKSHAIPRRTRPADEKTIGIEESFDFLGLTESSLEGLFAEYNHYAAARAIAELDRYAKSLNPDVLVSANSHRFRYVDRVADLTWCEDSNNKGARIDEQDRLTTPIGIYSWVRATAEGKKPAQLTVAPYEYWQLQNPEYYKLTVAEAASFQSNFVMLAGYAFAVRFDDGDIVAKRAWGGISAGLNFIERNPQLFEDAYPVADVALYYSHTTRISSVTGSRAGADQWQAAAQAFYLAGIPVRLITDEMVVQDGPKELLNKAKMVVLVGMTSLSDEELAILKEYVRLGGKVMATADSGLYTSFWTKRRSSPWGREIGGVKVVAGSDLTAPDKVLTHVGKFLQRAPMIQIAGRGYQLANPTIQGGRLILHILNYETAKPLKNLKVTVSPAGYSPEVAVALNRRSVCQWLTPDYEDGTRLPISWDGDRASIIIPDMRVSGVLIISAE